MTRIKKKIFNLLLAKLFLAVTEDTLIPTRNLEEGQRKELAAQARFIKESDLWKRMLLETKRKAQQQMFEKSMSWDDMYFGKAMLYVIDMLDKRLEALSKLKT
jgi:hypothetical protein